VGKTFSTAAAGAALARSAVVRDHSGNPGIDVGALFPGSPLAFDATDLSFSSCGIRSQARYSTAVDADGVRRHDLGMFRLEAELRDKHASRDRRLFDSDVIGVSSRGRATGQSAMVNGLIDFGNGDGLDFSADNFGASIPDAPNPVAKSANSVG